MNDRDRAMAALRQWPLLASPAERARRVAACWRAGERNVAEMARAAGVARDTIYTDLTASGIDYRDPRQREAPPMTVLTIDGRPLDIIRWREVDLRQFDPAVLPEQAKEIIRRHNQMVPACFAERSAAPVFTGAYEAAEQAYAALASTPTGDWAAAHHRWVLAEDALAAAAKDYYATSVALDTARTQLPDDVRVPGQQVDSLTVYRQMTDRVYAVAPLDRCPEQPGEWAGVYYRRAELRREREDATGRTLRHLTQR